MMVVDLDALIAMKQTQRAKDYAVIGELATLLPPEREIELTTNPDRIIALAETMGRSSQRPVARLAATGADRHAVVLALAEEIDRLHRPTVAEWRSTNPPPVRTWKNVARPESTCSRCARHTIAHWRSPGASCRWRPPKDHPMRMLSEDDVNLRELSDEQLDLAWDLWFDLAQTTNDWDPPYSHGVFVNLAPCARHPVTPNRLLTDLPT